MKNQFETLRGPGPAATPQTAPSPRATSPSAASAYSQTVPGHAQPGAPAHFQPRAQAHAQPGAPAHVQPGAPHMPPSSASSGAAWFEVPFIIYSLCAIVFPLGLYGLYKTTRFSTQKKWVIGGLTLLVWSAILGSEGQGSDSYGGSGVGSGGDCTATYSQNGCTYYRDSTCNVIARDCD